MVAPIKLTTGNLGVAPVYAVSGEFLRVREYASEIANGAAHWRHCIWAPKAARFYVVTVVSGPHTYGLGQYNIVEVRYYRRRPGIDGVVEIDDQTREGSLMDTIRRRSSENGAGNE